MKPSRPCSFLSGFLGSARVTVVIERKQNISLWELTVFVAQSEVLQPAFDACARATDGFGDGVEVSVVEAFAGKDVVHHASGHHGDGDVGSGGIHAWLVDVTHHTEEVLHHSIELCFLQTKYFSPKNHNYL